ncbi:MAG: hypothetical protein QXS93_00010 [Candidatus Micrarchaeia archaeon]
MIKQIFFITLAMMLVLSPVYAADACKVALSQDMLSIFSIGIIISLLLISLFYMAGILLESPDVEATMKVDLQQIGLTLLIAIIIGASLQLLCSINITPVGIELGSKGSLAASVEKNLLAATKVTLQAYLDMSTNIFDYARVGSIYGGISSLGVSVMFAPFSIYSTIAQALAPLAQMTLIAYFSLVFQYSLFKITQSTVFLYLLPIGLTLRAFPMFRKFGGVLVAVCLGMSFIYPLIVAVGFAMLEKPPEQIYKRQDRFCHGEALGMSCYEFIAPTSVLLLGLSILSSYVTLPLETVVIGAVASSLAALNAGYISQQLGLDIALSGFLLPHLRYMYASFATIIIMAFFLPILEAMIVSAIVRSLSGAIGAETDISGIMRAI